MISLILQPYSRLDTKNPYLSQTSHFAYSCTSVNVKFSLASIKYFCCRTSGKEPCSRLNYLVYTSHVPVLQTISYSRPKLSDFYALSQTKLRGFIKFLRRRSVGFFSQAFLVFLMKESKKRRWKLPGKLMAKSRSQLVNLHGARPLMNPL